MTGDEQLERALERLLADRSPRREVAGLSDEEQRLVRMAQLLRGSRGGELSPEAAERLYDRIVPRRLVSRRTAFLSGIEFSMRPRKSYWLASIAACALVAASLLTVLQPGRTRAQTATVRMVNTAFDPRTISIPVGGTITWVNLDSVPHTATEDHNAWTSPLLNKGDTYSQTFGQAGTVTYYCVVHPGQMTGTIIVGGAGTALPQATAQPTAAGDATPGAATATPVITVSRSPTAIATFAAHPSAAQLFSRSRRALKSARGYRISESATQLKGGRKRTLTLRGDVAAESDAQTLTLRLTTNKGNTAQTAIVQVRMSAWTRQASVDRTWKRVTVSRVDRLLSPLRNPLEAPSGGSVSHLTMVGPATFHGAPVWHIRWTETSGPTAGTVDALIAQKGFLPYVTVRSLENRSSKEHVDDRITRSRFGETIQIKPPHR